MKMKFKKTGLFFSLAALLFAGNSLETDAYYTGQSTSSTYIYNEYGFRADSPDAYAYSRTVDLRNVDEFHLTNLTDMCVTDEYVYLVDTTLGIIFRFDHSMNYIDYLRDFKMPDGSASTLNKPEGLYVNPGGLLYIADTGNSRVLVSDWQGNISQVILKLENLVGTVLKNFLPIRVVADSAGRISIVARNINSGIMQFTPDGNFMGYIGAPSVSVDAFSKLLRKFYTDAQRAATTTYVPTEYNNIKIDENNFIWGTISALTASDLQATVMNKDLSGSTTPIKKLNMKGTDVLARQGIYAPIGDLRWFSGPSRIVDVGLGNNNIYSMLDSYMGRIFTYNTRGILLYAFGNKGTAKGETQLPVALDYVGNNILVLDNGLCAVIIYEPTTYGQLLIDAEGYYLEGEYDTANECWRQVTELNSNFAYPYIGLGDAEYNNGNYEDAMMYYQYADDRKSYSNAKERIRKARMSVGFPYIVGAVIIFALAFVGKGLFIRARRYVRGEMTTYGDGGDEE